MFDFPLVASDTRWLRVYTFKGTSGILISKALFSEI